MKDFRLFLMGACIGALFNNIAIFFVGMPEIHKKAVASIIECEKTLPRNQHCEAVVTAVPVDSDLSNTKE